MAAHLGALQRDHLARAYLVDVDAAQCRQRARLAGDGVPTERQAADRQRPEPPRVAHRDDLIAGQHHERERALPRRQCALDPLLPRATPGGREHQRQHLGVARRGQPETLREQLVAQRRRVDDVAVVGERQRTVHRLDEERLEVALGVRSGRAVPGVADGVVPGERRHRLAGEDVGDEPGVLVHPRPMPVADGDAGPLLPTVLQREQPEERQLGDAVAVGRRDAEHPALFSRLR